MRASTMALLLLVVVLVDVALAQPSMALTAADQRCMFSSRSCVKLRSCRTCLNEELVATACYLDSRGLCLSTSSLGPEATTTATTEIQRFAAANSSYCPASDATCSRCLASNQTSGICTGADGACVCLAACEAASWEADVKSVVRLASAPSTATSTPSSGPQNSQTSASAAEESTTSPIVVLLVIAACTVALGLLVNWLRLRRKRKLEAMGTYDVQATPTDALPSKTLAGRI